MRSERNFMKVLFGIPILLVCTFLMTGCQSFGNYIKCSNEVDARMPAVTEQRYVRTETKCHTSGTSGTVSRSGDVSIDGTTTTCSSYPVYETVTLNQHERDAAIQSCVGSLRYQQNTIHGSQVTSQESSSGSTSGSTSKPAASQQKNLRTTSKGCQDSFGVIVEAGQVSNLRYLVVNQCINKQSFGWEAKMTEENPPTCRQRWDALEKSGKLSDAQYLVVNNCSTINFR